MTSRRGFGAIRALPSKRFQASYVGPDGVRHAAPLTFTERMDAEGWLRDERRLIENELWSSPKDREAAKQKLESSPLFESYADDWINRRRAGQRPIRESTAAGYKSINTRLLTPEFGKVKLKDITRDQVRDWYRALDKTKPRQNSKAFGLLRAIMNTAVDEELIAVSPVKIRGAGGAPKRRRLEPASLAELDTIVGLMPDRLKLMVLLASWCALRYGELAELRRRDVVVKPASNTAILKVRRAVVLLGGKKTIGPPKSEAGVRDVAIPPHLISDVKEHLKKHCAKGPNGLLFPGETGEHLWGSVVWKHYKVARKAAGRPDLRFHDLRHTGAVLAAQQGATIADLQARLGHSTAAAALLYQHTALGRDQLIAERLSNLVTKPGAQSDRA